MNTTSYSEIITQSYPRPSRFDSPGAAPMLVVSVVVLQTLVMGRAVVALDVALIISFGVWAAYRNSALPAHVLPVFTVALIVQVAHLLEEYYTGFHRAYPSLFGYVWEEWRFLTFNAVWLVTFAASAVAIARGHRLGYLGGFFLAIGAGIGNGIGHLALAAREDGYFPGLYTAVLSVAVGSALLARLLRGIDHAGQRGGVPRDHER